MARSTVENDTPQVSTPVGSLEEVKALGVPTRNICTCSEREDKKNAGCPVWDFCDRKFRGTRPQFQIYQLVTREGNTRITHDACFNIVRKEMDADDKRQLVEVIGGEGDEYTYRGSVKLHPVRNPNCNECAQGKCEKWEDRSDLKFTVPEFPPAADHDELVKYSRKIDARQRGGVIKKADRREALLGPTDEEPKAAEKGKK